jgi:hypothetical protein
MVSKNILVTGFYCADVYVSSRMPSSGIWRRVDILLTDVSEERIASIFRV